MLQKNYYQLLHVSPQATAQEIKAAYRKLAFKYHPDTNKGNTLSEAILKEINEAYGVLSHPDKRKKYNIAIAVSTSHAKHKRQAPITSHTILQEVIRMRQVVEKSNSLAIDQDVLFFKIKALLSDYHLQILMLENNKPVIHQLIQQTMRCMEPLHFNNTHTLFLSLKKLAAADSAMLKELQGFYQEKRGEAFWQRYKIVAVLIVALLLCLLMYIL